MHTETRKISAVELNSTNLMSFAMTALRISVPAKSRKKSLCSGRSKDSVISLEEISWHDNEKDCWVVIYDRVYDLTNFLQEVRYTCQIKNIGRLFDICILFCSIQEAMTYS